MNKEWIEKERIRLEQYAEHLKQTITDKILAASFFTEEDKQYCLRKLEEMGDGYRWNPFESAFVYIDTIMNHEDETAEQAEEKYNQLVEWCENLEFRLYSAVMETLKTEGYRKFQDSEIIEFDGDIIITDPCYIMKSDNNRDDWFTSDFGRKMEPFGFTKYITRSTLYGDWSCTTYDADTEKYIGEFCADAGLVSVFLLDEVLKYNPEFDYHINRKWTTTWIKNFKGTVQYKVHVDEEDNDGIFPEAYAFIVGCGINKETGELINFITSQTGW